MMISMTAALLCGAAFCMLRISAPGGSFPKPLSAEREAACIAAMKNGDRAARNELIEHNLRLVAHIVKKYYSACADTDDLISIGTIVLIKGVETFQPDRSIRLATYVSRCIENELLMFFRSTRRLAGEISLDEPLEQDSDGASLALMDVIASPDDALEQVEHSDRRQLLYRALPHLEERERDILTLRYGLDGRPPLTQREVAARRGISRSYISRLEKRAISHLAERMNPGM